jgi:predicted nucleic acid-binding protein
VILVDSSVWIDHVRQPNDLLISSLEGQQVLVHPFVIGEVALGHLRTREAVLLGLQRLPQCSVATNQEVLHLIARQRLFGRGVGYVDVHLLAAASLARAKVWTLDRKLHETAATLGLDFVSPG